MIPGSSSQPTPISPGALRYPPAPGPGERAYRQRRSRDDAPGGSRVSWRPIGLGLNAREPTEEPEDSAPESGEESAAASEDATSPSEPEPLGMASLRRLGRRIRKLGLRVWPALYRLWLWVPLLGKKTGRGLQAVGRWANKGQRLAKVGAAAARRITNLGRGLQRTGRDWGRAGGRLGSFGQRVVRFGNRLESGGVWLEALAAGAASLTEALRDLPPKLRHARQVRKARRKLRREAVREARRQASELPERLLPRRERGGDEAPARPAPAIPEPAAGPAKAPAAKSASRPGDPVVETAPPAAAPAAEPTRDPAPPTPGPRPRQAASSPPAAAAERPAATRAPLSRSLDELPFHVAGAVRALRSRKQPRKEQVREVIPLLLDSGERRSAADLVEWVGISQETLTRRHLGPLVDAGRIERQFPNRITHPAQTYRAVRSRTPEAG